MAVPPVNVALPGFEGRGGKRGRPQMGARKRAALSLGSIALTLLSAAGAFLAPKWWPLFAFFAVAGLGGAARAAWLRFAAGKKTPAPSPSHADSMPQRDWSMQDAHHYVLNEHYGRNRMGSRNPFHDFRQAARDGALTVWGRPESIDAGPDTRPKPHEKISPEHWTNMGFDYMPYVFGSGEDARRAATAPDHEHRRGNPEPYRDLAVSSAEVKRLWPPRRVVK